MVSNVRRINAWLFRRPPLYGLTFALVSGVGFFVAERLLRGTFSRAHEGDWKFHLGLSIFLALVTGYATFRMASESKETPL